MKVKFHPVFFHRKQVMVKHVIELQLFNLKQGVPKRERIGPENI